MDYSLANILCVEDIRTGRVCEDGIIGKDGYFTDYMEYAAEAVARGDMSELVHGRLDGIGKTRFFSSDSGGWKFFIPKKETP